MKRQAEADDEFISQIEYILRIAIEMCEKDNSTACRKWSWLNREEKEYFVEGIANLVSDKEKAIQIPIFHDHIYVYRVSRGKVVKS